MKNVTKNVRAGLSVLACLSTLAVGACESSQPVKTAELNSRAEAALAPLPTDQRARAEQLLREQPDLRTGLAIFIDGERFVPADGSDAPYEVINPDRIATIEVLRGADAEAKAGPGTGAGVVWITTKPESQGDVAGT